MVNPKKLKPSSVLIAHGNRFVGVGSGRNSRKKKDVSFPMGRYTAHLEGRAVLGSRLTLGQGAGWRPHTRSRWQGSTANQRGGKVTSHHAVAPRISGEAYAFTEN